MFNDIPEQDWTGSQITPVPEISSAGTGAGLTSDYYTLAYGENVNPNTYNHDGSVIITGKGKFKGTVTLYFEISRPNLYLTGTFCGWSTDYNGGAQNLVTGDRPNFYMPNAGLWTIGGASA